MSRRSRLLVLTVAMAATLLPTLPALAEPPHPHWPWLLGRGRIGIQVQPLTPELREHFGAPADRGVLVAKVEPDRPAAKAGIEVGDVVLAVDGRVVASPPHLVRAIHGAPEGGKVTLEVLRDGKRREIEVAPDAPEGLFDEETERWAERFGRHLEEGGRHLERRMHELERRLEELERELERRLEQLEDGDQQRT